MKIHEWNEMMAYLTRPAMAYGGRIGLGKGTKPTVRLTTDMIIDVAEKNPDYTSGDILKYFQKDKSKRYVTRFGTDINRVAIANTLGRAFDLAAEKAAKVPKNYISSAELFEMLPISKKDYFRNKYATKGKGTLLTREIDKLLKPQKVGAQEFYFKKPSNKDMKSFVRLADKTGRLNSRIADLMIDFDKVYGKKFAQGVIPTLKEVTEKFNISEHTAGKVTTRLAQWYGGQDFKNEQ